MTKGIGMQATFSRCTPVLVARSWVLASRPATTPPPRRRVCHQRVSRLARGTAGCGETLAGMYVKSGFIFPTQTPLQVVCMRRGATYGCMDVSYTRGGQWEWQRWR